MLFDCIVSIFTLLMIYIEIDKQRCVGCGICENNVPQFFKIDNFTARCKKGAVPAEYTELVQETARDCPADAIIVKDSPHLFIYNGREKS